MNIRSGNMRWKHRM
ncbi:hypothetical protein [Lepagella muris]